MSAFKTLARTAAVTVAGAAVLAAPLTVAQAKPAPVTGHFAVTVNGTTYDPAAGKDAKLKDLKVTGRIAVRGTNVGFDIDPVTLGVYDYTLTGAPSRVNYGDGLDPVASGPDAHQMLLGKDSPQVATKTYQDGTTTRWTVSSGGRMGGVLGEDAIELSAGASKCTSQCQAQERIRGSLPVPPLPTNPTPIG